MLRWTSILFALLLCSIDAAAQCEVDTNIVMNEVDTSRIIFEVEGASLNDLSDPAQGVCKVRIKFEHEFLGDLRLFLTSPGGQTVQLVGNEGNFGLTQFTEWDVCFVPASQVAMPDPGFSDIWSNNQTWGVLAGTYTGQYYPFFGALEDFDTGPVNGEWVLTAMDRTIFYQTTISEMEIEFCDPSGIECEPCDPPQIRLDLLQSDYCQNDTVLLQLDVVESGNPNQSLEYLIQGYLMDETDRVVQKDQLDTLFGLPTGVYQLCFFSIYEGDTSELPDVMERWDNWLDQSSTSSRCISDIVCETIYIRPAQDTTRFQWGLCQSDSLTFLGEVFDSAGTYEIVTKSIFGCDSVIILTLEDVVFPSEIIVSDTLDCVTDSVIVSVSPPADYPYENWTWFSENNVRIDTTGQDSVAIFQSGQVSLIMEYLGCQDTLSTRVNSDSTFPMIILEGDTLNCIEDSIWINAFVSSSNVTYEWFRNGSPFSTQLDSVNVGQGGTYSLVVTDLNGCSARESILILNDQSPPNVNFELMDSVCQGEPINLRLLSDRGSNAILWSGPNGFSDSTEFITVTDSGWYHAEFVGDNGCVAMDSVFVSPKLNALPVQLLARPVSCTEDGALIYRSNSDLTSFQWMGPNGFLSADSIAFSSLPGKYYFVYTDGQGCEGQDSMDLADIRVFPNFTVEQDSFNCLGDSAYLYVNPVMNVDSISWRDPDENRSVGDSILLTINGWYRYAVVGDQGCSVEDSILIQASASPPYSLMSDTLSCSSNFTATIATLTNNEQGVFEWTKNGSVISNDTLVQVSEGGWFYIEMDFPSGCTVLDSVFVDVDTLKPQLILIAPEELNCRDTLVEVRSFANPPLGQFQWDGPNGFTSVQRNIMVDMPGTYTLSVTSVNGCSHQDSVTIALDTIAPQFSVPDTSFNCRDSILNIFPDSMPPNWMWLWVGGDLRVGRGLPVEVKSPGSYRIQAFDENNGCLGSQFFSVAADTILTTALLKDSTLACGIDSLALTLPDSSLESWNWIFPNGRRTDQRSVVLREFGQYQVDYLGKNGCSRSDTFELKPNDEELQLSIADDTITCLNRTATISFSSNLPAMGFQWIDPQGEMTSDSLLRTSMGGLYQLVYSRSPFCEDTFEFNVPVDTMPPEISIESDGDLVCGRVSTALRVRTPSSGRYQFEWRWEDTPGGQNRSDQKSILVTESNIYYLQAVDTISGCLAVDSIEVSDEETFLQPEWMVIDPLCSFSSEGSIALLDVQGGKEPYTYYLNDIKYDQANWDRLRVGEYRIIIEDDNGCTWDSIIVLQELLNVTLDAGPDQVVLLGDTLNVEGTFFTTHPALDSLVWSIGDSSVAYGNAVLNWIANEDTRFTWRAHYGHCTLEDDKWIRVDIKPLVFVPNAFTPNNDDVNDVLTIGLGKNVAKLDIFIYDRWGELLAKGEGITPDNNSFSWDGQFNGQMVTPGVLVYLGEVLLTNGEKRLLKGSITLVR